MFVILLFLSPFLIGSIPFGLILSRLFGYGDIRNIGSGNIGATNVLRTGNKWLALLTLLLDGAKGYLPIEAIKLFLAIKASEPIECCPNCSCVDLYANLNVVMLSSGMPVIGFLIILGHIFPIWFKFKGGKGVATALGTFLAIFPIVALVFIFLWILIFLISKISSLSALGAFLITALVTTTLHFTHIDISDTQHYIYLLIVTALIFATHRSNIIRLIKGTEPKFTTKSRSISNEPS